MTGMEWIDSHDEKYSTEVIGDHVECGGELIEVKSKSIRFLICRRCRAESFQKTAEDMKEKRYR